MSQQPLILAVETSGRIGSVAIGLGERILDDATFSGAIRHSSELFPTVQALLTRFGRKPAQIQQVYICVGPGSFTGLRIGVALAKTMHLANRAKIVAVDTLDAIAANASDYAHRRDISLRRIAAVLDAKRGQFYIAAYEQLVANKKGYKKIMSDRLMTPLEFLQRFACQDVPIWLLGDALLYYKHRFQADGVRTLPEQYWSAQAKNVYILGWELAKAGEFADPLTLQPTYIRRPEAEEKWQQRKSQPLQ